MKVSLKQRLILVLAALILLPVFVTPLWSIQLVAPQYSDGLGMYIGVSEVWGHEQHDIQNINILNHYIGMKPIDPDGIPELDIFPPILGAIIAMGLIAAAVGRRWIVTLWLVAFIGLATAGLVDFYMWMIDYGHNLDPLAAIKVPGMTYTPPLIGSKQLLNITANSWPAIGSLFLGISMALAGWVVFSSYRRPSDGATQKAEGESAVRNSPSGAAKPALATMAMVVSASVLLGACGTEPRPDGATQAEHADRMVYGESEDPYCGELVQRVRWGGEIVTTAGEALRFHSVECMAGYIVEQHIAEEEIAEVKAVDFSHGWRLIDVREARFLHTPNLASPAGRNLNVMAISTDKMATNLQEAYTGPLLNWDEVLAVVSNEWQGDSIAAARQNR